MPHNVFKARESERQARGSERTIEESEGLGGQRESQEAIQGVSEASWIVKRLV